MGAGESKHRPTHRQPDRPDPPGKPSLVPGTPKSDPDIITIKWNSPEWNGGAKLSGYLVEQRRTGSAHWVRASPVLVRGTELTLSGLEPGMRYQFRATAEGPGGRSPPSQPSEPIAVSYHRTFASAPCFVRSLDDTVAIENEQVEFTVQIQGTPTPKLIWYKDGFEVFSSRRQRIVNEADRSTLVIHQASFNDEGEIKCSATNKAGHVVTKAKLTLEAPPTIRLPRQYEDGLLFELGETVRLKVSVTGRPTPHVTWLHNGETLTSDGRHDISTTEKHTTLRIPEATRADRGEYQVKASNRLGEDVTSFLVTITDRPLPPGKAHVVMTLGRCVTLSWSPPSDDGGCKIGNYIVEYYRIGWNMWLKAATCRQLTTTLGDLIEGSEYKFRVKAENPYGMSDPSEESDVIFIPDPKRGLLEPLPRDKQRVIDESAEWMEARKRHNEIVEPAKAGPLKRDRDEVEEMPSEVVLAHQVLRKVKMAPKRGWSEDSQGSPPREPSPPVPPQRKYKIKQPKLPDQIDITESDNTSNEGQMKEEQGRVETNKLRGLEETMHGSSELMLVLLPGSRATTEERDAERRETLESLRSEDSDQVAPPLSLSAPELSSCEPIEWGVLRASVSSTELMHEKAMARMFQEVSEEEAEESLRRRYGIERKRSFEKRSTRGREPDIFKELSSSTEKIQMAEPSTVISGDVPVEFRRESKRPGSREEDSISEFSERFLQSDKVFNELGITLEEEEEMDLEEESLYDDDLSDLEEPARKRPFMREELLDEVEEETYHPRSMVPRTVTLPPVPMARRSITPEPLPQPRSPVAVRVNEREVVPVVLEDGSSRSNESQPLKPILKVREVEKPQKKNFAKKLIGRVTPGKPSSKEERVGSRVSEVSSEESRSRKKVRIEEPAGGRWGVAGEEGMVGEGDREILLTGEVARNRRKMGRGGAGGPEEADPARVVISHYSDIVKEFGRGKRSRTKIYLDYEDLKAAAERSESACKEEESEGPSNLQEDSEPTVETLDNQLVLFEPQEAPPPAGPKPSAAFLLDLGLFFVASFLYFFKDPRLAIPVLVLMVYRQIHETLQSKLPKKWRKEG